MTVAYWAKPQCTLCMDTYKQQPDLSSWFGLDNWVVEFMADMLCN